MEKPFDDIRDNLEEIHERVFESCMKAGRSAEEVSLLGVTKTVEPARIRAAISFGLEKIGENKVQEYLSKRDELELGSESVHLIGHLQTNKVSKIVGKVSMIESVDSLRLAAAIGAESVKRGIVTDVLAEINLGQETTKSGISSDMAAELVTQMSEVCGIRVRGLMSIPPIYNTTSEKRTAFSKLYKLFIDIRSKNIDNVDIDVLSMGMSDDYCEAVAEGSTQIRIGSALFGSRIYRQ